MPGLVARSRKGEKTMSLKRNGRKYRLKKGDKLCFDLQHSTLAFLDHENNFLFTDDGDNKVLVRSAEGDAMSPSLAYAIAVIVGHAMNLQPSAQEHRHGTTRIFTLT